MPKITITPLTTIPNATGETRHLVRVDLDGNQFEGDDYRKAGYQCAAAIRKVSTDGKAHRISSGGSWGYNGQGTYTEQVVYSVAGLKSDQPSDVPATIREACDRTYSAQDAVKEAKWARALPKRACQYSAAHAMKGTPATTIIDCGLIGKVPACQPCADFYQRMS